MRGRRPVPLKDPGVIILDALAESPGTFTELLEHIGLSTSTLAKYLEKLEDEGSIVREYTRTTGRRRKNGKPRREILIKLSEKELPSVKNMLRRLADVTSVSRLNIEKGEELLEPDVIDALLMISSLSWQAKLREPDKAALKKFEEEFGTTLVAGPVFLPEEHVWRTRKDYIECLRYEAIEKRGGYEKIPVDEKEIFEAPPSLNERDLLRGYARYSFERYEVPWGVEPPVTDFLLRYGVIGSEKWGCPFSTFEEFAKFYEKEVKNPEMFPATGIARKKGVLQKLDKLLIWIRPLLEPWDMIKLRKKGLIKRYRPIFPVANNLAATVFARELADYANQLIKVWHHYVIKSRSQEVEEPKIREKGG